MDTYRFMQLLIQSTESASYHFQAYDNDMAIYPGQGGEFHYEKKICMLGKSFVSTSATLSGWEYETKNEINGFLISVPHTGEFLWRTNVGSYKARAGTIAVADMRQVYSSAHAPGMKYTSVYIDNSDMFRYLSTLLGFSPKNRVYFDKPNVEMWKSKFITGIVNSIFDIAENSGAPLDKVASSLKESLVGFIIYNFSNNYSRVLHNSSDVSIPTPHKIKIAAEYMASNTDPELTVGEIAIFAGISVRSLQSGFKRYKSMTPIQFLRNQRLLKSKSMISEGGGQTLPQDIARRVGFLNYQVFCKYYLQLFGEHPNETFQQSRK